MRALLISLLVAATSLVAACAPCPQVDCPNTVQILVVDADRKPLSTFSGVVTLDDRRYSVSCVEGEGRGGGVADADAGTSADGGQLEASAEWACGEGLVYLHGRFGPFGAPSRDSLTASLSSGSLAYEGPAEIEYVEPAPRPELCDTRCSLPSAEITLR